MVKIALGVSIDDVRELRDFANNMYFVVEFVPSGYAVYDVDFVVAMELSLDSVSLYKGDQGDLVYGWPTTTTISLSNNPDLGHYTIILYCKSTCF